MNLAKSINRVKLAGSIENLSEAIGSCLWQIRQAQEFARKDHFADFTKELKQIRSKADYAEALYREFLRLEEELKQFDKNSKETHETGTNTFNHSDHS